MTIDIVRPRGKTAVGRLTQVQADVLGHVRRTIAETGRAPTYAETGAAVGRNRSSVFEAVQRLCELGYVRRDSSRWRAMEVVTP